MIVKNAFGREIEIDGVCGEADDVQIDNCFYVDGDEEVTSEDIDYIMHTYGDELYGEYMDQAIGRAEDRYDLLNDR